MNLLRTFAAKLASATGLPLTAWARLSLHAEPRSVSATITASGIQSALRAAESGDVKALFALYRDITLDNHVQAELQKRKLAVICEPWQLVPNDKDDPADVAAAEACDTMIERCKNWSDGLAAQLDSVVWPLATCEKIFRPGTDGLRYELEKFVPVNPATYCFRPPASGIRPLASGPFEPDLWFFDVDPTTGYVLTTTQPADPERHWVYRGHLMVGLRDNWGGPMRGLVFWWLLRNKGRDWFAHLIETWGKPYPAAFVEPEDKAGIDMLTAAFAPDKRIHGLIVSTSTRLEMQEIALSGSADAHEKFGNLCNREISLLIVGQTLSSQAQPTGLGSGTADLQGQVRGDLRAWDQLKLGESLRQNVFAQFLRINGLPGRPPRIVWGGVAPEKIAATADTLVKLSQAGLEPTDEALPGISETVGFELQRKVAAVAGYQMPDAGGQKPDAGNQMPDAGNQMPDPEDSAAEPASGIRQPESAPVPLSAPASGIRPPASAPDPTARLVRTHAPALATAYRGAMAPFRAALLESTSREDALGRLQNLYADWPAARLADELERALQLAAASGAAGGIPHP